MNTPSGDPRLFSETSWQALQYFNLYRLLIALLFVGLIWIGQLPEPLGLYDKRLFSIVAHLYLLISIIIAIAIRLRLATYILQVASHVIIDIIMLSLMMYASNGLSSGFGMLLVIAVAGGSLLSARRIAVLFAAIATLVVLGHEAYIQVTRYFPEPNYPHAGMLGVTFFATAILGHILAARVEQSEALVKQHAVDLESLAQLNQFIVQRMQAGILVLDEDMRIRLVNESALILLGLRDVYQNQPLQDASPELAVKLDEWLDHRENPVTVFRPVRGDVDIQVTFTRLKPDTRFGILVLIEDMALMRQRAQDLKLASLGRLAASIAHEVRNPLGAISHAGQLLSESGDINNEEDRLIQIIMEQSRRVNTIIENVQHISRREPSTPEQFLLKPWLEMFLKEFMESKKIPEKAVKFTVKPADMQISMDPSQLQQVVWNLSENAVRYSRGNIKLEIHCGIRKESRRPYIDIIDHGKGMNEEIVEHLFEPFFTTDSSGTGLGLYIARELCEANQAALHLHTNSENGCCFRIHFSNRENSTYQ